VHRNQYSLLVGKTNRDEPLLDQRMGRVRYRQGLFIAE